MEKNWTNEYKIIDDAVPIIFQQFEGLKEKVSQKEFFLKSLLPIRNFVAGIMELDKIYWFSIK